MIGGKEVDMKKWTFLVQLKFLQPSARWKICSATIIDKDWLVTAAHCVDDLTDKTEYLQVKIGNSSSSTCLPYLCSCSCSHSCSCL